MKWWYWIVLELLIIFGVMTWIFFFPSELCEKDFYKGLSAYGIVFCIEKMRKCLREK